MNRDDHRPPGGSAPPSERSKRERRSELERQVRERTDRMRAAEEHFRLLVEGSEEYAIFMLDPAGRVVSWNPGAERIKQYAAGEILGEHFSRFYPAEDVQADRPRRILEVAAAEGKYAEEGWRIRKDGSKFWASVVITALRDEAGKLRGFSKVTRDLTARQAAEDNARRLLQEEAARREAERAARVIDAQREQLRVTLASIGDGVITADVEGRVTSLNPVAEALTGWTSGEAVGQPLQTVFAIISEATRKAAENPAARVLATGRIAGLANSTLLVAKDGTERPIDDSAAPIRDADGKVSGVVLVFRDITERRRTERALRERQERYELVLAGAGGAIWDWDVPARRVDYSPHWKELRGLGQAEVSDREEEWSSRIHPDDVERVMTAVRAHFDGRTPVFSEEYRVRHKNGHWVWIHDRGLARRDATGRVIRMAGSETDITVRKNAEQALRASEERYRAIVESQTEMVCRFRPDGTVLFANGAYARARATTPEALVSTNFWQLVDEEDRPGVRGMLGQLSPATPEVRIENRFETADGPRWTLWTNRGLSFDAGGRATEVQSAGIDITQRTQMEQSLRFLAQASKSLSLLVDYRRTLQEVAQLAVPAFADWCAVDVVDDDGFLRQLAVAHREPENLGWAETIRRLFPADPNAARGPARVQRTGKPELVSGITDALLVEVARDEAHLRLLRDLNLRSCMCIPLKTKDQPLGVMTFVTARSGRQYGGDDLAMAEDLANRAAIAIENARLYQEAREADRRKDEFLAMLAHELRNPLAPIRSGLEILALAEGGNHATITLMQEQVQQLVRLVEDLLDVSRIMEGRIELRREPMMLSTLIGRSVDAVHALAGERQLELVVTLPEQPVWVSADPVRLVQVFGNLLNNAIKYTDTGGRIELTAETRDGQAIVTVRDTGIGIEPELLPRIFDLFTQSPRSLDRAQGGLGIGLTLVRRLVELHDGWVAAHSEGRGRGSTFTLCLPVTQPATQDGKTAAAPRARTVRPRRVLVVDDNPGAAGLLAVLLTELGAQEVETAQDGPSALQKIREWHPEIVLLDIGIPGMDGYQVAKAVRDMPGLDDVTLIALTGYGRDEDRRRSREAGFDLHLVKPVTSEELEQVLTEPRRQAGKTERRSGNRAD